MDVAIGFDTSCYTTSVAAVDAEGNVIASHRMLLPVESGQRGLRQSEAVFAHVRQMPILVEKLGRDTRGMHLIAVAASTAPRAEEGSYMPVFRVGHGHAVALASMLNVPFYGVSHQQGHIAAGQIGMDALSARFVALHVSGGTTELMLSDQGKLSLLGGTLDLHAGQLIDRIGVAMGMDFPAGPALESLALQCPDATQAMLPVSLSRGDVDANLSGAETRCLQWLQQGSLPPERIAAELFDFLSRMVARMLVAGCKATNADQALVVGGVASSLLLRQKTLARIQKMGINLDVRFGQPQYSADNAAGVAWLGMQAHQQAQAR